ncbi:hypothetical protein H5410_048889 [Solanum commersonii]|uniref:Uncharacterized protein n=1 Tax=Solanum commersonii TaxID=4109 RepID=A0A9J5XLU6_SOLCO|nr:hypothetical protein H5410_048889 [Solanum commersonii]
MPTPSKSPSCFKNIMYPLIFIKLTGLKQHPQSIDEIVKSLLHVLLIDPFFFYIPNFKVLTC